MEPAVYNLTFVIIVGAALLVVGLGIGLVLGRRTSTAGKKQRETERKLDQLLQDQKTYEDDVVEHFTDTAKLLNNLTERYRDVHTHLAKGANDLCKGRGPVAMDLLEGSGDRGEIPAAMADIHPPLDYAPKTSPDQKGMLNEEFGIERGKVAAKPEKPDTQPPVVD